MKTAFYFIILILITLCFGHTEARSETNTDQIIINKINTNLKNASEIANLVDQTNSNNIHVIITKSQKCLDEYNHGIISNQDFLYNTNLDTAYYYSLLALINANSSIIPMNKSIWIARETVNKINYYNDIINIADELNNLGISTIYLESITSGYALYNSKYLTYHPLIDTNIDRIELFIKEAHKNNISIQAWIWVYAVGNKRLNKLINLPDNYPGPIITKYKNLSLNESGLSPEYWLNPASEQSNELLLNIFNELLKKYNFDGIQLDYIRYPFQSASKEYKSRCDNISNFVKTINQELKKHNPNLIITAAVFGIEKDQRESTICQQWEDWLSNSWINTAVPMLFTSDVATLEKHIQQIYKNNFYLLSVSPGIHLNYNTPYSLAEQVLMIQNYGISSITFFDASKLDERKSEVISSINSFKQTKNQNSCKMQLELLTILKSALKNLNDNDFNHIIYNINCLTSNIKENKIDNIQPSLEKIKSDFTSISSNKDLNPYLLNLLNNNITLALELSNNKLYRSISTKENY